MSERSRKPSRGSKCSTLRVSLGCLTCRTRRKKCDERTPICTKCERDKIMCTWPIKDLRNTTDSATVELVTLGQPSLFSLDSAENDKAQWRENIQSLIAANEKISSELRKGASLMIPRPLSSSLQQRLGCGASNRLLEHYTQITAAALPGRIIADNPYLTNILPLAFSDDKVLHSILALSGVHLAYKSVEYEYESRSHYAAAVRGVREGLVKWKSMDPSALLALLTSMLSLCMCEVVDGNTSGASFHHLRASREILLKLRSVVPDSRETRLLDFLTEQYAFFAITSNITLNFDSTMNRHVQSDSLLQSLHTLNEGSVIHGFLFGYAHQLFEFIPRISDSARDVLPEPHKYNVNALVTYYERQVRSWDSGCASQSIRTSVGPRVQSPGHTGTAEKMSELWLPSDQEIAGRLYQQALLVFLFSSFYGSERLDLIDPCLDAFIRLISSLSPESPIWTTLMWPTIIAGSCMRSFHHRDILLGCIVSIESQYEMLTVKRMGELLQYIWYEHDHNESVYGPCGIEMVMRKRAFNVCVG